ncbi:unnamed protein product [Pieris macdunnoughi]|uniref:Uncharacterized protein n=1 Tax=Pieris macdunnoughi TaxID=345717 RepID=A0A821MXU6_9NEOP|nr:unnamed protein product [Pieris macdunnoughi]
MSGIPNWRLWGDSSPFRRTCNANDKWSQYEYSFAPELGSEYTEKVGLIRRRPGAKSLAAECLQILAAFSNIPEDVTWIKRRSIFNNYSTPAPAGEIAYFKSETILAEALGWKMRPFLVPNLQWLLCGEHAHCTKARYESFPE